MYGDGERLAVLLHVEALVNAGRRDVYIRCCFHAVGQRNDRGVCILLFGRVRAEINGVIQRGHACALEYHVIVCAIHQVLSVVNHFRGQFALFPFAAVQPFDRAGLVVHFTGEGQRRNTHIIGIHVLDEVSSRRRYLDAINGSFGQFGVIDEAYIADLEVTAFRI